MTLENYCDVLAKRHEFEWRLDAQEKTGPERHFAHITLYITTRQQVRYKSPQINELHRGVLKFWLLGILQGEMHQRSCDKIVRRKELL
jgi:hypothetical protein